MWRCTDCRQECDEPHERTVPNGTSEAWGQVRAERELIISCPNCGSECIEELEECDECGGTGVVGGDPEGPATETCIACEGKGSYEL